MNVLDYLNNFKDKTFEEVAFGELDALICSQASYFPFLEITDKKVLKGPEFFDILAKYVDPNNMPRKENDIKLLRLVCSSKRFSGIKFTNFKRSFFENEKAKQFQALTIILPDFIFVSFCGTDGTLAGWKEDFDMAFLEMVPSEVEAVAYLNEVKKAHPFKRIYVGGHSKGGRLAITAAKHMENKKNLAYVYSFDGPNYLSSFYDEEYMQIKSHIYKYTPEDSVIGRLINDNDEKTIVKSNALLMLQHDPYTWEIETNHFLTKKNYGRKSTKIVKVINNTLKNVEDDDKRILINSIYHFLYDLDITKFRSDSFNKERFKEILPNLSVEWRFVEKEKRQLLIKTAFVVFKEILKVRE